MVASSVPLNDLMNTAWMRHHLYMVGSDLFRLKLYEKLSNIIKTGGGPMVKSLVFEMTSFIRSELGHLNKGRLSESQLKDIAFFGSNLGVIEPEIYEKYNIPEFRWLYITVGYLMLTPQEELSDEIIEKVISIYMKSRNTCSLLAGSNQELDKLMDLVADYFDRVPINYKLIYNTPPKDLYISLHETKDYHIMLPPLPKLKNRENLVKSLIHKELYRAWLLPDHFFAEGLKNAGIDLDPATLKGKLKYELSFLDGLGDLYLAQESSHLLYRFRGVPAQEGDGIFGTRTYNQLRVILQTNTLLSQLTVAYNLHKGLEDKKVQDLLMGEYTPNIDNWDNPDLDNEVRRYEQEFLADYFEQYVGALYLEQPEVALKFILQIYENTLRLISDVHRLSEKERKKLSQSYNYRAWCVDVIGRNIWR